MTARTVRTTPRPPHQSPDFTRLTSTEARRRVAQLLSMGLAEGTVAVMVGWSTTDVRRAMTTEIVEAAL